MEPFRRAQELVYSETGDTSAVERLLEDAQRAIDSSGDDALRDYWTARVHLLLGMHYNRREESDLAEEELQRGFEAIDASIRRAGEYSEGLRVKSDLHSQMMFARGLVYMARNGGEARDLAFRALELDPDNIHARITVAGFYLNAPGFAGGDPAQGREMLESALARHPENESDRFLILGLLAQTAMDAGDESAARGYLRRATAIYPDSKWVDRLSDELG